MSKILYQIRQILRGGITSRNIHEFKRLTALLHVHAGAPVSVSDEDRSAYASVAVCEAMTRGDIIRVQAICLHISNEWHLCRGDLPWAL